MARVKIEVDDEVVDAVFSEKDDFRLSVRGMTLMEAVLVEAIGDTFADRMPKALERLDWPSLVALAKALELIDADLERALLALWNVRNIFAHEIIDEVTERQIELLANAAISLGPTYDWKQHSTGDLFKASMYVTWDALLDSVEQAENRRLASRSRLRRTRRARRAAARPRRGRDELVSSR